MWFRHVLVAVSTVVLGLALTVVAHHSPTQAPEMAPAASVVPSTPLCATASSCAAWGAQEAAQGDEGNGEVGATFDGEAFVCSYGEPYLNELGRAVCDTGLEFA